MDSFESLKGTVEKFLFKSDDNGFVVFRLQTISAEIIVTGYLPSLNVGQDVELLGSWQHHKKFGKQFNAKSCSHQLPATISGLKKYLGSGLIKGIGKVYAEKLVNHFGQNILKIIDEEPTKLQEVDGIGLKRIEFIANAWKSQKEISNIMIFLQDKGVSAAYATRIYKHYKSEALAVLQENPYRLADEVWGIGFKLADQIAQKIGFSKNSPQRIKSGITFVITSASSQGHLYVELEELKNNIKEILELNDSDAQIIKNGLINLYESGQLKFITWKDKHYITIAQYYYSEHSVAQKIKTLISKSTLNIDINKIYQKIKIEDGNGFSLNEPQQLGILTALQNRLAVITGGPGTGKTTLVRKLLEVLDEYQISYKLAAPTGRAAKRMMESSGKYAMTIHRLLEFDPKIGAFKLNEKNALKTDFLIVDEASMIDIFLANSILKAVSDKTTLLFIGDVDQLPSVGAGNFLKDIIDSQQIPIVKLTQVFRQKEDSLIIVNAHKINRGEFPVSNLPNSKKDFIFIKEEDAENLGTHLKSIYAATLKKHFINIEDAIVLTPMNKGLAGTMNINNSLQNMLNPDDKNAQQIMKHGIKYKVGDRVMQIRNNYDKFIFNGDIGVIQSIDQEEQIVYINFNDNVLDYSFDELDEIVLAYSITIHKSQGSEYGAVIIPIFMQHFVLLAKNLVYTGITRAKKLCIIIGQPKALAMAIKNKKEKNRLTFLKLFLTGELA